MPSWAEVARASLAGPKRAHLYETIARANSDRSNPIRCGVFSGRALGPYRSYGFGLALQFLLADLMARTYAVVHVGRVSIGDLTPS